MDKYICQFGQNKNMHSQAQVQNSHSHPPWTCQKKVKQLMHCRCTCLATLWRWHPQQWLPKYTSFPFFSHNIICFRTTLYKSGPKPPDNDDDFFHIPKNWVSQPSWIDLYPQLASQILVWSASPIWTRGHLYPLNMSNLGLQRIHRGVNLKILLKWWDKGAVSPPPSV